MSASKEDILASFHTLEVKPYAPLDEVKKAHRDLASVWHPDRFQHNDRLRLKAEERLKEINHAYDIIRDYYRDKIEREKKAEQHRREEIARRQKVEAERSRREEDLRNVEAHRKKIEEERHKGIATQNNQQALPREQKSIFSSKSTIIALVIGICALVLILASESEAIWTYAVQINALEAAGLVFGLLAVWLLIKQNIWTWPAGIIYVFISFVIFYQVKLYADLALHVVFLALNVYGWYYWIYGKKDKEEELPVTRAKPKTLAVLIVLSALGIAAMGTLFTLYTDAAVPYWDSTTTVLSLVGMWLTAKKKIENWHFWFVVDVLATGIYVYKGIYFYALLYLIYIGMAVAGYRAWRKDLHEQDATLVEAAT